MPRAVSQPHHRAQPEEPLARLARLDSGRFPVLLRVGLIWPSRRRPQPTIIGYSEAPTPLNTSPKELESAPVFRRRRPVGSM